MLEHVWAEAMGMLQRDDKVSHLLSSFHNIKLTIYMVDIDLYKTMGFKLIVIMQDWDVSYRIKSFGKMMAVLSNSLKYILVVRAKWVNEIGSSIIPF